MRPKSASVARKSHLNSSFQVPRPPNDAQSPLNRSMNEQLQIPYHVLSVTDPEVLRKQRMKDMNRKYDQLLEKILFLDHHLPQNERRYVYSTDTLMPYIYFFKLMAKRPYDNFESENDKKQRLKLWIPDTIVLNDRDNPGMWFYSSAEGYIYRSDMFVPRNVVVKFSEGTSNENELSAVIKKPQYKNLELVGNDVKTVQVKELQTLCSNIMGTRGDVTILQKYVRSKGPKAFICRSVWRRSSNPIAWLVTNKHDMTDTSIPEADRVIASGSKRFSCTIIPCAGGRFVQETMPFVDNVLAWMRAQYKVEFDEIACDFVRARDNKWYFINLRGFAISKCQVPLQTRHITHYGDEVQNESGIISPSKNTTKYHKSRIKQCKYCQVVFPAKDLAHQMTLKMVLQTDLHLLHRGRRFPWIQDRVKLQHIDIAMLYHQYPVCQSCYTLYLACEGLMNLEFDFARRLGIEVSEDTRYNIVSISHLDTRTKGKNVIKQPYANQILGNGENYVMPQDWELQAPPNSELLLSNNQPTLNNKSLKALNQYRMVILLHRVTDIPNAQAESSNKYSIQFNWFQNKIRYPLDLSTAHPNPKGYSVQLNRLRMFYFFAPSRDCITELFNALPKLDLMLFENNERIGLLECELSDFKSERVVKRDFFKQFQGKLIHPILSWGLHLSIGVADSGQTDIDDVRVYEFHDVYLPESTYYTCEPLPSEWVHMLQHTQNEPKRSRSLTQPKPNGSSFYIDASRFFNYTSSKKDHFDQLMNYSLEDQQEYDKHDYSKEKQMQSLLSKEIEMYESETKAIYEDEYSDYLM